MKKEWLELGSYGTLELSLWEQIHIDGGGFWETFGIVLGVATVIAAIIYAPILAVTILTTIL